MKRLIAFVIAAALSAAIAGQVHADTVAVVSSTAYKQRTAEYVYKKVTDPSFGSVGGEWVVIGLARSEYVVSEEYYGKYISNLSEYLKSKGGVLSSSKYTEYSRVVLALSAIGLNAANFESYDLVKPLGDVDTVSKQGNNSVAFALLALDSVGYEVENEYSTSEASLRDRYVEILLNSQNSDGGWNISKDQNNSDADTTAMVLQALAKYVSLDEVSKAVDRGINYLSNVQLSDGGFETSGVETCESNAQVLIALSELGIPYDDVRFVKNGKTPLDALKSFMTPDGGFKHSTDSKTANQMASEQALCALTAVERMGSGNSFYSMGDTEFEIVGFDKFKDRDPDVKYVDVKYSVEFSDISADMDADAINELSSRGIINGRGDGYFVPSGEMTRAEFSTVVVRALGLEAAGCDAFSDVNFGEWFYEFVGTAYSRGIVNGVGDGLFKPNNTLTREEAAVMVSRAAKLCGFDTAMDQNSVRDVLSQFSDYRESSDWAREGLAFCYSYGILDESELNILPKQPATRYEVALMIYNLLKAAELL